MKISIMILFLGLLAGCSSIRQTQYSEIPNLLIRYPLPDVTNDIYRNNFSLTFLLYIDSSGNVQNVRLIKSSGSSSWDSSAVAAIMKWKYTPAAIAGKKVPAWVRQKAIIEYRNPVYLNLEEILCENKSIADSVYASLNKGFNFSALARQFSVSPSSQKNGDIGRVNINQYSEEIRNILITLDAGRFTRPIKFGNNFIIFKRSNGNNI